MTRPRVPRNPTSILSRRPPLVRSTEAVAAEVRGARPDAQILLAGPLSEELTSTLDRIKSNVTIRVHSSGPWGAEIDLAVLSGPDLLDEAYAELRPGARIVVPWNTAQANSKVSARDAASRALFRAGFVNPRYRLTASGLLASAERPAAVPPADRPLLLTVILPVYNEHDTFRKLVNELLAVSIHRVELEIIIVESNSTDGTREEALSLESADPRITLLLEERARGKGHAVRTGLARATGDVVLIQDADLEYDIADYEGLLLPLQTGQASFVLGARTKTDGARWGVRHFERQVVMSHLMNLGNSLFLTLFNAVYGQHLADPFTMFKVVRRDCLLGLHLESNRFDLDWEMTAKLIRLGYAPLEVPVSYQSRSFSEGKKISLIRDPLTWIRACFKYRFVPLES